MSFEEKSTWMYGALAIITYGIYAGVVLNASRTVELTEVDYVPALLWAIGASIIASIVLSILVTIVSPKGSDKRDTRDRQIDRRGELAGRWFVIAGALGALILAMVHAPHFWIANVIYLGFVLAAVLASVAKIVYYRRGMPAW